MSLTVCVDSSPMLSGLSSLYANRELTDLRLVCTDGYLLAHKSVLAAVSDQFRQMITADNSMAAQTVIVFADVSVEDLKTIIDCVYFSQQRIDSKRFKELVKIGDKFGIKLRTAVSAALDPIHVLTPMPTKSSGKPQEPSFVVPNNVLIPNDKKYLKPKPLESYQSVIKESPLLEETPMDLSVTSTDTTIVDNVQKIIDSIALNGPQSPSNRRRKQSDPKPIHSKVVRFEERLQLFGDHCYSNGGEGVSAVNDLSDVKPLANNSGDVKTYSADDQKIETNGQTPDVDNNQSKTEPKIELKEEVSTLSHSCQNSATKVKSVGRSPKSSALSEEQLKDCTVCGKTHSTHKQLILHLNKEHKTNDCFKCSVCGKEQKYAKTFAVHSLQCQSSKV